MALCRRQCNKCQNAVTVCIDTTDPGSIGCNHITDFNLKSVTNVYNMIIEELSELRDVAVILRVGGIDIAERCYRSSLVYQEEDCVLF